MKRWQGVFPAVTTKFDAKDRLDIPEMERCFALQAEAGAYGLIVAGTLGEGHTLDMLEKTEVLRAALRVAAKRLPVLMTICNPSTREACLLAEASAKNGADGLMVLTGPYRSDPHETEAHYRAIARAGGIRIMIDNDPISCGVDITPELLAKFADEPLFCAVKESSGDVRRITRIINMTGDRYDLFAGADNLAFESLVMGAKGWVAGLVAAFARETIAIWRYATMGHFEEARRLYRWFQPLLDLEGSDKLVQNIKRVESMIIGSNDRCRPPRLALAGEERARITRIVEEGIRRRPKLPPLRMAAE
jgi:1-pyrroline-4-hydroxy-2-carboxylate deaminase